MIAAAITEMFVRTLFFWAVTSRSQIKSRCHTVLGWRSERLITTGGVGWRDESRPDRAACVVWGAQGADPPILQHQPEVFRDKISCALINVCWTFICLCWFVVHTAWFRHTLHITHTVVCNTSNHVTIATGQISVLDNDNNRTNTVCRITTVYDL
jgi:hypothetical protein